MSPMAAPRPCRHAGCHAVVRDGSGYCPVHRAAIDAAISAAAAGLAKCYWDGMFHWLKTGRQLAKEGDLP